MKPAPDCPGASLYGAFSHAPRDPSAPSANSFTPTSRSRSLYSHGVGPVPPIWIAVSTPRP